MRIITITLESLIGGYTPSISLTPARAENRLNRSLQVVQGAVTLSCLGIGEATTVIMKLKHQHNSTETSLLNRLPEDCSVGQSGNTRPSSCHGHSLEPLHEVFLSTEQKP